MKYTDQKYNWSDYNFKISVNILLRLMSNFSDIWQGNC